MTDSILPAQPAREALGGEQPDMQEPLGLGDAPLRQIVELRLLLAECKENALKAEAYLDARLDEAERRIAFLEEEPQLPMSGPVAPSWVQAKLHRAVARAYHVFELLDKLQDGIERYEDALLMARAVSDDLRAFPGIDARLELLSRVEEALQELVESSVSVEALQEVDVAASEAREEIEMALQETEVSPLRLGPRMH